MSIFEYFKKKNGKIFIAQKKKKNQQKFTGFTVSHLTSVHHTESA